MSNHDPTERSPLLSDASEDAWDERLEVALSSSPAHRLGCELLLLLRRSIPVSFAYTLQMSLQTVSVLLVGRLGPDELAAAASAYMIAMVTGWTVALGGTTALDTLASPLFTASPTPSDVGVLLQRGLFVLYLLYIPVAALWFWIAPVFRLLGQHEGLSDNVQAFLRVLIIGAPAYIGFESVKKYLQVQGLMSPSTLVLAITAPICAGLNVLCVHTLDMGLLGAPLATSISYWIAFVLLSLVARLGPGKACWAGLDRRALSPRGCVQFLKLAVPGILMVGTEWWAFEIVALLAGRLPGKALAAQGVIMTCDQVMNTLPFGVGVSSSSRLGNLLGLGRPAIPLAKLSSQASASLSTIFGALVMLVLLVKMDTFGYLFSDDAETVAAVADVLPYVAAFQIFDGWAGSCGGLLRGMGRQHIGAIVNVTAYYLLALPLGAFLAFNRQKGLAGLWFGQCLALFLVGAGEYIVVTFGTNWEHEVDLAWQRVKSDKHAAPPAAEGRIEEA